MSFEKEHRSLAEAGVLTPDRAPTEEEMARWPAPVRWYVERLQMAIDKAIENLESPHGPTPETVAHMLQVARMESPVCKEKSDAN